MWRTLLLSFVALLTAPPAAQACTKLPAGFAGGARVEAKGKRHLRTTLCVRAAGRRIVLRRAFAEGARGTVIRDAAAAGRRVAWIETRLTRAGRVVVVRSVRVDRRGRTHPLRRIVAARDRSDRLGPAEVLLTARGDLAWIAPHFDLHSRLVLARGSGRPRTIGRDGQALRIEDRLTLAWNGPGGIGFHDLFRPRPGICPPRSAYREVASNDAVIVTARTYADTEQRVHRACVISTGRDRVIAQANDGFGNGDAVAVAGLDRHWVVLVRSFFNRYDTCNTYEQRPIEARSGRRGRLTSASSCGEYPDLAGTAGQQLAVTDDGVAAWTVEHDGARRLLAVAPGGGVSELDRGAIGGLRAQGTAVSWFRDGQPRSAPLP